MNPKNERPFPRRRSAGLAVFAMEARHSSPAQRAVAEAARRQWFGVDADASLADVHHDAIWTLVAHGLVLRALCVAAAFQVNCDRASKPLADRVRAWIKRGVDDEADCQKSNLDADVVRLPRSRTATTAARADLVSWYPERDDPASASPVRNPSWKGPPVRNPMAPSANSALELTTATPASTGGTSDGRVDPAALV